MHYTTRQVSTLLGLSEARVRAFVREGVLDGARGARGEHRFTFQDLVVLRTAKGLLEAKVAPRRVKEALQRLRRELPERPLTAVQVVVQGEALVVRDGAVPWEPESGQVLFDFDLGELAATVEPLAARASAPGPERGDGVAAQPELGVAEWFGLGAALELEAPREARDAYRRALELDPFHADAHLALGRLLLEAGLKAPAEAHARAARASAPDDARAACDHGLALERLGEHARAAEAYRRAADLDPRRRDAHLGLSRVLQLLGDGPGVLRALAALRRLGEES
jgi:tetratricopeptide (TPR) repeat protein